jgi:hypothetical protein
MKTITNTKTIKKMSNGGNPPDGLSGKIGKTITIGGVMGGHYTAYVKNAECKWLYFNDSNTTINRSNAYLSLGLNFTSTASDILTLIYISGFWYEVSRSINS